MMGARTGTPPGQLTSFIKFAGERVMEKLAASDHPIHEVIRSRWSPRAFSKKPVPADALKSLFEAARWAASSYNDQPWAYIVATREDAENFNKLLSVLMEGNHIWAKNAPVLALAVARLWRYTRWPGSTPTRRGKCFKFPRDGNRLPRSPSAIRVMPTGCPKTCDKRRRRRAAASPCRSLS